jgi:hypothetical protein
MRWSRVCIRQWNDRQKLSSWCVSTWCRHVFQLLQQSIECLQIAIDGRPLVIAEWDFLQESE